MEKHPYSVARKSWVQVLPGPLISHVSLSKLSDLSDSIGSLTVKWGQSRHRVGLRIKCDNTWHWVERNSIYFISVHVRNTNTVRGQDLRWRWITELDEQVCPTWGLKCVSSNKVPSGGELT